ncbi:hypothetical protein [Micromonospora sp. NPDC005324]|uniref:hypothetical protein n=1 Tax=Micromonospora sp. NPDC005324 TaxID=3157033 RepID=UPI0033BB4857
MAVSKRVGLGAAVAALSLTLPGAASATERSTWNRAELIKFAMLPAATFVPGSEPSGSSLGTAPTNGIIPLAGVPAVSGVAAKAGACGGLSHKGFDVAGPHCVDAPIAVGGGHSSPRAAVGASGGRARRRDNSRKVLGDRRHGRPVTISEVGGSNAQVLEQRSGGGDTIGIRGHEGSPRMRACRSARTDAMVFEGCTTMRFWRGRAARSTGSPVAMPHRCRAAAGRGSSSRVPRRARLRRPG